MSKKKNKGDKKKGKKKPVIMAENMKPPAFKRDPVKIQLYQAFLWNCPNCKGKNYDDGVFVEISPSEQLSMAEELGGSPDDYATGEIVKAPDSVTCSQCKQTYEPLSEDEAYGQE